MSLLSVGKHLVLSQIICIQTPSSNARLVLTNEISSAQVLVLLLRVADTEFVTPGEMTENKTGKSFDVFLWNTWYKMWGDDGPIDHSITVEGFIK